MAAPEATPTPDLLAEAEDGSFTIHGLAQFLGCSDRHAYRLVVDQKEIRGARSGTRVLVSRRSAREYLARILSDGPKKNEQHKS